MFKSSSLICALLACFHLFGQIDDNYNGIYSVGNIPEMITNPTYQTYAEFYKQGIDVSDSKKEQKLKKDFVLSSSYYINDLLISGDVVFGHDISLYLEQLKNKLVTDKSLADQIHIYLIKSAAVNAFATHHGVIVISTGLLERLDNEAQLAYIISHEISHFVKKHGINSHVEAKIQEKTNKEYRKKSNIEKYLLVSSRSREHEFEADEYAFNFYKNSNYDSKAPKEVFEILKKSHLPYRTEASIADFFSPSIQEKIANPTDFSVEALDSLEEEILQLLSSHPALGERIKKAEAYTKSMSSTEQFIVSKAEFEKAKNMSKIETVNQLINDHQYEKAIYSAYLLQADLKENKYYSKLRLRLFYEMWEVRITKINADFSKKYGVDFSNATQDDLKEILTSERNQYVKKWKNDIYVQQINKQLDGSLISMNDQFNGFKHISKGEDARNEFLKQYWKSAKGKRIDKVLIVDPQWVFMDNRVGEHFVKSELQAEKFIDIAQENAKKSKLATTVFSYNELGETDIIKYNELNLLIEYNKFIMENEGDLIYPRLAEVQEVSKKYGTDNLVFLACYTNQHKLHPAVKWLFGGISLLPGVLSPYLIPIFAPAIMTRVLVPEYESYILFQMYNTKNHSVDFVDAFAFDKKSSKTLLNYQFYNYFKLIRGRK